MSNQLRSAIDMLAELRTAAERFAVDPKDRYARQQLFQAAERAKKVERQLTRYALPEPQEAAR